MGVWECGLLLRERDERGRMKAVQVRCDTTARATGRHTLISLYTERCGDSVGEPYFFLAAAESSSRLRDLSTSEANFWKVSSDT